MQKYRLNFCHIWLDGISFILNMDTHICEYDNNSIRHTRLDRVSTQNMFLSQMDTHIREYDDTCCYMWVKMSFYP